MKWLLTELAILLISVFILVPMLIVMVACLPFSAIWSLCVDDDGGNNES
jgi:antirestriction protein